MVLLAGQYDAGGLALASTQSAVRRTLSVAVLGAKILPSNSVSVDSVSWSIGTSPVSDSPRRSTRKLVGRSPRRCSISVLLMPAQADVAGDEPHLEGADPVQRRTVRIVFGSSESITGSRVVMTPASTWSRPSPVLSGSAATCPPPPRTGRRRRSSRLAARAPAWASSGRRASPSAAGHARTRAPARRCTDMSPK